MQRQRALFLCLGLQPAAQLAILIRIIKGIILKQRFYVQTCTAGNYRQMSARINSRNQRSCTLLKIYNAEGCIRRQNIHQMMRHSRQFFSSRLRRTDIHIFINQH